VTRAALVALAVLLAAGGAEAAPASVAIGDLVLDYDDADWHATAWPGGVRLQPRECRSFRCAEGTGVTIAAGPAHGPLPSDRDGFTRPLWDLLEDPARWPGDGTEREINGLAIHATDRWSGCRAMSPSELRAVLDHGGRRYTMASGVAAGCAGLWGVGRDDFVAILSGLRPRE